MGRGPSYPYIGLEEAVVQARKVYDYAKRGPAAAESVVTEGLKYSATSSSGEKVLAALKYFGLLEDAATSNGKAVKLTQKAIRILLDDQNSAERQEELRSAALAPKWYEYCWKKWGTEMPPAMRSNLLIEHGFVESTIDGFLKNYKASIAFAGLLDSVQPAKAEESKEKSGYIPKVGEYVQWESQGTLRMPAAKRVTGFSPDRDFAFVEGSPTGIPIEEVIPSDPPAQEDSVKPQTFFTPSQPKPNVASTGGSKMQTETFALPDGVTGQLQWPSVITSEAYDDFVYQLEGLKRRVLRAVKKDLPESDVTSSNEG